MTSQQTDAEFINNPNDTREETMCEDINNSGESHLNNEEEEEKDTSKKRKNASVVWDHFKKSEDGKRATCNYCGHDYACDPKKNGTSTIESHMNLCKSNPHK